MLGFGREVFVLLGGNGMRSTNELLLGVKHGLGDHNHQSWRIAFDDFTQSILIRFIPYNTAVPTLGGHAKPCMIPKKREFPSNYQT